MTLRDAAAVCTAGLPLFFSPAAAHPLHDNDAEGRPLVGYDARVTPPTNVVPSTGLSAAPAPAAVFGAFPGHVRVRWDERFFFVESDGMPDHPMMVGITAWQQQVPIPQRYTGENAWQFPLRPVPAKQPLSARSHFFRGAIAIAANGVPIFNPIKNDGRTDTFLAGELDEYGGHAGRADDYHYHVAPLHLQSTVGEGRPLAYALDGYAIYGLNCGPNGAPRDLDACNGHATEALGYHYHATKRYPYLNGGFHGEVVEREGQVDPQPRAQGPRPATEPLRGATITGFKRLAAGGMEIVYTRHGQSQVVRYAPAGLGWRFEFVDANGQTVAHYFSGANRSGKATREASGEKDRSRRPREKSASEGTATRQPWILVHAAEMDSDRDGQLSRVELDAEIKRTFESYDGDGDGRVRMEELALREPVRSALGGFFKQHADEIDADRDGALTAAELGVVVGRMFDRAKLATGHVPALQSPPSKRGDT